MVTGFNCIEKRIILRKETDEVIVFKYIKNEVEIEVMGTKIKFTKSNRSRYYTDSREPKKKFNFEEVFGEFTRMLGEIEGAKCFYYLE